MDRREDAGTLDRPPAGTWHAEPAGRVLERLGTGPDGLAPDEAARRLAQSGPNRLEAAARRPALLRFLGQFKDVLIYVLIGAGAVTLLLGEWVDAGVIFGVVVLNALIGFFQEGKAEQALDAIRVMLSPQAGVLRAGRRITVPAEELVPGDLVYLASGDKVPADLRIVRSKTLQIQEAALTGESVPVSKSAEPVAPGADLADRTSMAYSGTLVTYGQGQGVVVATGQATEIGRISTLLAGVEVLKTPLVALMERFGRQLTVAILALAAGAFAFGVLLRDYAAAEMFMAAVGIAVAAIPEGLPAVMTITLAIGVTRMAGRNAIIRRLPAVETLGSVSVICSDKTGTLTRNELTVQQVAAADASWDVGGIGYRPDGDFSHGGRAVDPREDAVLAEIIRAGVLCNDASLTERDGEWGVEGDPTDGALLTLGSKAGIDPAEERRVRPRTDLIPFESEHRFMATLNHDHEGHAAAYVKGAPERVIEMCERELRRDGPAPLDAAAWHDRIAALAARGQRVLAVATREMPAAATAIAFDDVGRGLVLLGLVGLVDPPRTEAVQAVRACRSAGIPVKMITGDHAGTARAIGAEFGLGGERGAVTGAELEALDDTELAALAREAEIFARTTPEHKLRLVRALQASGASVAMTGDGVNDAPALKRADVGIAMGQKGTEAAKEASDMVLADDNFASIAHAVEEGRTVYDNLRKAILFILPTNAAQATIILVSILLGQALPITPVQILWVNMITAVTLGLALAFERPETDIMDRPPRPREAPLLSGYLLWRIGAVTALLVPGSFGLFLWVGFQGGTIEEARTAAVNALVMGEIFYLWNARYILAPSLNLEALFGSRPVLVSIAVAAALQLGFTYLPFMQALFGTAPIDAGTWGLVAVAGAAVFVLVEAEKAVARRWRKSRAR